MMLFDMLMAAAGNGKTVVVLGSAFPAYLEAVSVTSDRLKTETAPDSPFGIVKDMSTTSDGSLVLVGHSGAGVRLTVYRTNGISFATLVGAIEISLEQQPPGDATAGCSFTPDGQYIAAVSDGSPYLSIYKRNADTWRKMSGMPAGPGAGKCCAWSDDGTYLAVGYTASPYLSIYKRDGDAITLLTSMADIGSAVLSIAWAPGGAMLLALKASSPAGILYSRVDDDFTQITMPALAANTNPRASFSGDGARLAVTNSVAPYELRLFDIVGTAVIPISATFTAPGGFTDCGFLQDPSLLACSSNTSPRLVVYRISGTDLVNLPNPSTLPTLPADRVCVTPPAVAGH